MSAYIDRGLMLMDLLKMKNIVKTFPKVVANDNVNFSVKVGEIHALLGENGAGKTTLMNILYGLYQQDSGTISWKGEKVNFNSPKDAIAAGIGMVHQHFTLIPNMTVLQNIILGLKEEGYPFIKTVEINEKIQGLAGRYGLKIDTEKKVSELSIGEQQRVEIIKALYRGAELLILDEPTAVLTPNETEDFFNILRRLKVQGHSVILITHRLSEIMAVSDRVTILRNGTDVAVKNTSNTDPASLAKLMIGSELPEQPVRQAHNGGISPVLELEDIKVENESILRLSVNMRLYPGEIVGVAGVDGNGQKELAEVICGIQPLSKGTIKFENQDITNTTVYQRYRKGIAYIPDDRHRDGLVLDMNLRQNLMLRNYKIPPYTKYGSLDKNNINSFTMNRIEKYQIKPPSPDVKMRLLSGGNQQKSILAREISDEAILIVACQPTRGLDIGATMQVRNILVEQRNRGAGILLISADLEEIMSLSDRVAVLFRGQFMGFLDNGADLDTQILGRMMGGHTLDKEEDANE